MRQVRQVRLKLEKSGLFKKGEGTTPSQKLKQSSQNRMRELRRHRRHADHSLHPAAKQQWGSHRTFRGWEETLGLELKVHKGKKAQTKNLSRAGCAPWSSRFKARPWT